MKKKKKSKICPCGIGPDIHNHNQPFPKRIILGEGYPWAYGLSWEHPTEFGLNKNPTGVEKIKLNCPKEWASLNVKKIRLIAEEIE